MPLRSLNKLMPAFRAGDTDLSLALWHPDCLMAGRALKIAVCLIGAPVFHFLKFPTKPGGSFQIAGVFHAPLWNIPRQHPIICQQKPRQRDHIKRLDPRKHGNHQADDREDQNCFIKLIIPISSIHHPVQFISKSTHDCFSPAFLISFIAWSQAVLFNHSRFPLPRQWIGCEQILNFSWTGRSPCAVPAYIV